MDYKDLLGLLKSRRSIRAFTDRPVAEDTVDKIIEAAHWAPSGANSQPWEFIVIRDQATKDQMAEWARQQMEIVHGAELARPEELRWPAATRPVSDPPFTKAPVLILVVGDPRVNKSFPAMTYEERQEKTFMSGLANAFLYMALAANSLGLGCHWASIVSSPYVSAMIDNLLDIPDGYVIYDMLVLGYPAMEAKPRAVRDREDLVHHEKYDKSKYRSDEQVRDWVISLRK